MRAIVTGGAGFIGSHLVDALIDGGDEVTVVDNLSSGSRENVNPNARFVDLDIREGFSEPADVIFHLAAQADVVTSVREPAFDAEVNVVGTVRVLEAAQAIGCRVVFASTGGAIYGECERPAREDDPRRPISPYGTAKLAAEEYLLTWNRLHGSEHVACRLGNVYGPRQRSSLEGGVVAIFLDRMRDGLQTEIFGDGEQTRDYVYVGDVVDAFRAAAASRTSGIYNVCTGTATSVLELHRLCAAAAGVAAEPRFSAERPGDIRSSVLDPGLTERELGWSATTSLADGIARTWNA